MAKKKKGPAAIVKDWGAYWDSDSLENWQKLMCNLGFGDQNFRSKTQCRKALKNVWVNIRDFLDAVKAGRPILRFATEKELSQYTLRDKGRIYPRKFIKKGSPLRDLMAHIF